jgi:hypothetical protein
MPVRSTLLLVVSVLGCATVGPAQPIAPPEMLETSGGDVNPSKVARTLRLDTRTLLFERLSTPNDFDVRLRALVPKRTGSEPWDDAQDEGSMGDFPPWPLDLAREQAGLKQ